MYIIKTLRHDNVKGNIYVNFVVRDWVIKFVCDVNIQVT